MKISDEQLNALDPIRRLVWQRSKELGLTLLEVSQRLGRNQTYIHQYLMRGSPRSLPEDVREGLAVILNVSEDQLRDQRPRKGIHVRLPAGRPRWPAPVSPVTASAGPGATMVPVFTECDVVDPQQASEWCSAPAIAERPGPMLAFWIATNHGRRLLTGDLAFVRVNQPARPGDDVVVLQGKAVACIGDLVKTAEATVIVDPGDGRERKFDMETHRVLRIAAVSLP